MIFKISRFPLNSYIRVPCDVNSGIRPTTTWFKNNYPLDETSRVRVLFNNTLAIDRAQSDDGGNYRCRASNGYNEAEDSVDLVVEDLQVLIMLYDDLYLYYIYIIGPGRLCGQSILCKLQTHCEGQILWKQILC